MINDLKHEVVDLKNKGREVLVERLGNVSSTELLELEDFFEKLRDDIMVVYSRRKQRSQVKN